jgi:hypothetical protein
LDTNGVPGAGLAAVVAAEAAIVGAIDAAPYNTAPATPPANIDPAIAIAAIDFRTLNTSFSSESLIARESVGSKADGASQTRRVRILCVCRESWRIPAEPR